MITSKLILWLYIGFLVAGGFAGYFKGKSPISLYTAVGFGVVLGLCALGILPFGWTVWLQTILLIVFASRYVKTRKLMPAGMLFMVTLAAMILQHLW